MLGTEVGPAQIYRLAFANGFCNYWQDYSSRLASLIVLIA